MNSTPEKAPARVGVRSRLLALAVVAALVVGAAGVPVAGNDKKSKRKKEEPYALLVGSVFDGNGLRMRGVTVRIREKDGKRKWEAQTNGLGEFAVHLPPGPAVYIAVAAVSGYAEDTKEVSFTGEERQDISLRLWRSGSGKP